MTDQLKLLKETEDARENAQALLQWLVEAKSQSDANLAQTGLQDHVRSLTGKSSIENAIVSTRRMIDTLTRHLDQFKAQSVR